MVTEKSTWGGGEAKRLVESALIAKYTCGQMDTLPANAKHLGPAFRALLTEGRAERLEWRELRRKEAQYLRVQTLLATTCSDGR